MKPFIMRPRIHVLVAASIISTWGYAQLPTTYPEVEPNSTKTESTVVHCVHDGDYITGATTGATLLPGDASSTSVDTFRVATCTLPLGLYRHRLIIQSATPGQLGALVGRNQVNGVIGPLDVVVQASATNTIVEQFNEWYGFGKGEEMYYRVSGTPSTTAPYSVVVNTTPLAPVDLTNSFIEGSLVFSTVGQGHKTNTDMWLYSADFQPLSSGGNDNRSSPLSMQSFLQRPLSPGTYYLAISASNLANDQASPVDDGDRNQNVVDFPDVVVGGSDAPSVPLNFAISDSFHTYIFSATTSEPFDVLWYRFVVLPHAATTHVFCAGDGHPGSEPCPCGNNSPTGDHGCAGFPNINGAYLDAVGLPSVLLDSIVLRASDMPMNSVCLFFQGNAIVNSGFGSAFNDGLLCTQGSVIRLGTKQVDPLGEAVYGYQQPGDQQVHVAGLLPPGGGMRFYQAWYRNSMGPCGYRSNTSNGLAIHWAP